jgi:hypothetical protein
MDLMYCFVMFGFIILCCCMMIIYLSLTRPYQETLDPMDKNGQIFLSQNELKGTQKHIVNRPEKK